LARYRDKILCYNDDIQGTAGAALTGLMGALRVTKNKLADHRVLFLGAGSAGVGIADLIVTAMIQDGLSEKDARGRVSLFDIHGLIQSKRTDLLDFQKPYAHDNAAQTDRVAAIEALKPSILIGVSTKAKAFNQKVIETMARLNKNPVIFALSNPTDHAECSAEEAYKWSGGRALFASGVPFDPVRFEGRLLVPGQGNNVYVFPAVSLAVFATEATRVTDEMFIAAARGVAENVTQAELDSGSLYPPQSDIFETEVKAAVRVAETIFARKLARVEKPGDMEAFIRGKLYTPKYPELV
jgi:malate dehydrogenase (oxaloacetate-decarboxylating)(NADP+)